jgi:hypothetical protein
MNMAANMLGLDNAATPAGLKAMEDLQEINHKKDTASNPMILFLVINTSSVMLIPISTFMIRNQMGCANPTAIFIPILIATISSTVAGIWLTATIQKIKLLNKVVMSYFAGLLAIIAGLVLYFIRLTPEQASIQSSAMGNFIILSVMVYFLFEGFRKKLPVYEVFVDGAKEGFQVAIRIIPYLVAMLVAIALFRASGCMDILVGGF